ncbi:carbohydrate ABC transporter permease [Knoellia koreensis]|uniref:Sugar ABC transporter permease n=1 Tax=Knoellia koreensis TaxID=2730921 RepID=A0A849HLV5_9MICO|nr:sugar ABC transporter permease [Knoellia sp. DB2414S]NNM48079.1 sugar ABC transporter permease [Knoellia sp. DB2414S]
MSTELVTPSSGSRDTGGRGPGAGPGIGKGRRKKSVQAAEEARTGLAFISPTLIIVLVMVVLPILWTVSLAFQKIKLLDLRNAGVIGDYTLDNFAAVLTSGGFLQALLTTLAYSIFGTAFALAIGLVAALALRRPFRGRGLVRAVLLLPYVAPVVAAAFVWSTALNPQYGIVNDWGQGLLGWKEPIAFLSSRSDDLSILGLDIGVPTALLTVIAFEAWRSFPFAFLFLTARLEAMPDTFEEAAVIDGATPLQRFRYIVFPQLWPTLAVLSVLRFIWTFNNFDDIYLLTGGGAGTEVVAVRVFNYLTARYDIGAAAAQALVLAAILAVLVLVYLKLFGRSEDAA